MATMSLTYTNLQDAVAQFLYGKAYSTLAAGPQGIVSTAVQNGYRQFLYPPAVDGVEAGYQWSFLRPVTTLTTVASYATGSVVVSSGICTLTGGTWPTWAATNGVLTINNVEYTITTRTNGTTLVVVGVNATAAAGDWTLDHNGDYDLPADFGNIIGDFTFARNIQKPSVRADVGEGTIRRKRQWSDETGEPQLAGIRVVAPTGTAVQRKVVMFWPRPDEAWVLSYRYESFVDTFETGYPAGFLTHAETLRQSCLAAAELTSNDRLGPQWELFKARLIDSVARDKKEGQEFFGDVGPGGQYDGMGNSIADSSYTLSAYGTTIQ